jgi:hypothetical protein
MNLKNPHYFTIHGHFYQPPRENPWTDIIENQESAHPFHDWNDRIAHECYSPNGASRLLSPTGRIQDIVNNYEFMSFNIGPTLMSWIRKKTPETYQRIQEADRKSAERLNGHGNAIAQVYNHMIMPLATPADRITQIRWGIRDFEFHFNRKPEAIWLAETAINMDTIVDLIREGIRFTILSPTQAQSYRKIGETHWSDCSHTNIDTLRPYRIYPKDAEGKALCEGYLDIFFYHPSLSSAVGFEHLLRDANVFGKRILDVFDPKKTEPQLVNIGTDGESYGHHEPFGDMCAAWLYNKYAPDHNMVPVNYGWFLEKFPPQYEVTLKNMYGEGSAWSCEKKKNNINALTKTKKIRCGELGFDYGFKEKNSYIGGITCVETESTVYDPIYTSFDEIGICEDGSRLLSVSIEVKTETKLVKNEIHYVYEGYVFPDDYVTTKTDVHAMKQHELGHQKFNTCVDFPENIRISLDCVCENKLERLYIDKRDAKLNLLYQKHKELLDEQSELFHRNYGLTGYAESYTCPSK